jgi:hypothetical protein
MLNKKLFYTPALIALWMLGCAENEGFKSSVNTKTLAKTDDAKPEVAPIVPPITQPPVTKPAEDAKEVIVEAATPMDSFAEPAVEVQLSVVRKLEVVLPSAELRSGGKTIQAKAIITGAGAAAISWKISGPAGIDLGSIDGKGLYTSPADETIMASIQIVATLIDDPAISDKKPLALVPVQQLFVGCKVGNAIFPITGDIFELPPNTPRLPDFDALAASKKETVCMDKFDIPNQGWLAGFPASPKMVEWFAIKFNSTLIIPKDGDYSFRLVSDDGSRFAIDDKTIVDHDNQHSFSEKFGTATLKAGKHKMSMGWFQGPRPYLGIQLFWKTPGATDYVIVPTSAFATYVSGQ